MTNSIIFGGPMSSGKDTIGGKFLRDALTKKPQRVIANCWLNMEKYFPELEYTRLSTEELYEKHLDYEFFRNSYLYLSEVQQLLESRSSNSIVNKSFTSNFLTQIGKLNCKIIMTVQIVGAVDLRVREWTPYRILCKRYVMRNNTWVEPSFYDERKLKEQIGIKMTLNWEDILGKDQFKEIGVYLPTQEDYDFFNTEEMFKMEREKYKAKR